MPRRQKRSGILVGLCTAALAACSASAAPAEGHQAGKDWPAFLGNDQAWSYSPLDRINRDNVARLAPAWAFSTGTKGLGATPLVVDGIMYLVAPDNHLFALDAATGKQLWSSPRPVPTGQVGGTGGATGLAMGFGLIFLGTLDNHLVAVDAKTGRDVWDVQIEDYRTCKCTTSFSPIMAGDKVVVGARGDVAHRGYITAYDAKTGKQAWRFWTVPAPGEKGGDTWPGDTWKFGGVSAWYVGSYDPEQNLVFWGTGNPQPMMNASSRTGDNLYADSVVAIDADTGKLRWYFQEIPHDSLDYDAAPEPVLLDLDRDGQKRKLVLHASKAGYTYLLDRETGKFVGAWPHADAITWTKGIGKDGKPIDPVSTEVGVEKLICPSIYGSRAGNHSAYSPHTGWWYNVSFEVCALTKAVQTMPASEGDLFMGGFIKPLPSPSSHPFIAAFDPLTGERKWTHPTETLNASALTATGGDLIFGGDPFGIAYALDARTGKTLWSFSTGGGISASPISYEVGGRQYVAIASGMTGAPGGLVPALWPQYKDRLPPVGSTLFVFALPEANGKAAGNAH